MCATPLGRKYTMVIGALVTMAFFFAYTQVRTKAQNIVFSCVINFCLNIYYGTLYAYTPEVLPSAHRGTGNGIAIGWNRVMGILSAVIATSADVSPPSESSAVAFVGVVVELLLMECRRRPLCQCIFVPHCTLSWQPLQYYFPLSRTGGAARRFLKTRHGLTQAFVS